MSKINWKTIGSFIEGICEVAFCGLMIGASHKAVGYVTNGCIGLIGYDEAIKAIMQSSMYSHDKCEAIEALNRKGDVEFYKAIIHIASDSRLYSHDKVDLIKGLCEKEDLSN